MKKILILGGSGLHVKMVKAAKEMGLYTIVTDYLPDSPAKAIADKSYMTDVTDAGGIVSLCEAERVDGVIGPYIDPCQRPYYEACHALGYYCYIDTKEQLISLTDKKTFRRVCLENGVDTVPEYSIARPEEIEYPVLVKPALNRGGRGQTVCRDFYEMTSAVKRAGELSDNGGVVVEKYMGIDNNFTMTLFFADGEVYLTKTSDIYTGTLEDNLENVHIGVASPSRHTGLYLDKAHKKVVKMLKNLGVKNGPVFMQGFVDGDTVRFYDPGFRFPGSAYDLMLLKCLGVDMMKTVIEFSLTGNMKNRYFNVNDDTVYLGGKRAMTLTPVLRDGVIGKIEGIDRIAALPGLCSLQLNRRTGDAVTFSKSVRQRVGAFEFVADSTAQMKERAAGILSTLKVTDTDGENMLFGNDFIERIPDD